MPMKRSEEPSLHPFRCKVERSRAGSKQTGPTHHEIRFHLDMTLLEWRRDEGGRGGRRGVGGVDAAPVAIPASFYLYGTGMIGVGA